jgi:nitroreductase
MSILDELTTQRRSVRTYKADMPPEEWIAVMLRCAAKAPSPTNSRPVRFVRIKSRDKRAALHRAMHQGYQSLLEAAKQCEKPRRKTNIVNAYWRYSEFINNAPLLFAVGVKTDGNGFSKRLFEAELIPRDDRTDTDLDITVGLALKGFLLKGTELGLGMCILTAPLVFAGDIDKILGLSGIRIKCLVTAGYPDETPPYLERMQASDMLLEI